VTENKKEKKDGGTIDHWQLHKLSANVQDVVEKLGYDVQTDACYILTGTVIDDPTGRWQPGWHMRSSVIVAMDLEKGWVETQNTFYKLGENPGDVIPDLGDGVGSIFY